MAIAFARLEYIGISNGKSAVALSAYIRRSAEELKFWESQGVDFSTYKDGEAAVLSTGVILPPGSPSWDATQLWNEVEKAEIAKKPLARGEIRFRKNAQFAKHYILALPSNSEVTHKMYIEMTLQYIQKNFTDQNIPCEYSIHLEEGNPHIHILAATRRLHRNGFDSHKARDLDVKQSFSSKTGKGFVSEKDGLHMQWADFQNQYFVSNGLDIKVDPTAAISQVHEGKARHIKNSAKVAENQTRLEELQNIARNDHPAILEALVYRQTTFNVRDLNKTLKKHGIEDDDEREVLVEAILKNAECVPLFNAFGEEANVYTSRKVRAEEAAILGNVGKILEGKGGAASAKSRAAALASKTLDTEQREAFDVMTAENRLCVIQGRAGAGKSYTMGAAREAFEADGWRVVGLAPTNAVSRDMAKDGFKEASTLHSELLKQENPKKKTVPWDETTVVFVDEAAMMDNSILLRLTDHAERTGAKLVLIGDDAQLSSVQRGGMYSEIRTRTSESLISQVRRQKEEWMIKASMNLADGRIGEAIEAYNKNGHIIPSNDPIKELLEQWKTDALNNPSVNRFVYAGTNAEVNAINDACSEAMREAGHVIGAFEFICKKGDLAFQQTFGVGDRLQINATAKNINSDLINGSFGTVQNISDDEITVLFDTGQIVTWKPSEFNGFALGYAGTVYKGQGKTQTDVYALHGSTWDNRTTYVGATRHKGNFRLYVDKNKVKSLESLVKGMSRSKSSGTTQSYYDANQILDRQQRVEKMNGKEFEKFGLYSMLKTKHDVEIKHKEKLPRLAIVALELSNYGLSKKDIAHCLEHDIDPTQVKKILAYLDSQEAKTLAASLQAQNIIAGPSHIKISKWSKRITQTFSIAKKQLIKKRRQEHKSWRQRWLEQMRDYEPTMTILDSSMHPETGAKAYVAADTEPTSVDHGTDQQTIEPGAEQSDQYLPRM
ncbi:AAA family ATPase [Solidesulfovibrio magneticus]|uniref:Conjugal transfer protein TraA n=1 Tax=Solidesulfovibrio magneticus (strain ATCC 700980 / DSM 13731 / RS-1) TaxID=573370 RepID=C4XNH4_SOLM1|nr:AAA family ATPase [Solidesulfovibrio magneticus]BAH74949.1 conjugal transfer protein TraA [Solidesulfovibrio magneticus RS-1]